MFPDRRTLGPRPAKRRSALGSPNSNRSPPARTWAAPAQLVGIIPTERGNRPAQRMALGATRPMLESVNETSITVGSRGRLVSRRLLCPLRRTRNPARLGPSMQQPAQDHRMADRGRTASAGSTGAHLPHHPGTMPARRAEDLCRQPGHRRSMDRGRICPLAEAGPHLPPANHRGTLRRSGKHLSHPAHDRELTSHGPLPVR